jgi:glutathione peroxidase-family protein
MSISSLAPRVGAAPLRAARSAALGGARVAFAAAPRGARPAARRLAAAAPAQALLGSLFDALKPPTSSANTLYDIAGVKDINGKVSSDTILISHFFSQFSILNQPLTNYRPLPKIKYKAVDFSAFKGKVVLYVNVASACGLTQQNYAEMPLLQKKFGKDLVIIGQVRAARGAACDARRGARRPARRSASSARRLLIRKKNDQSLCYCTQPCNQFGAQEPGSAAQIEGFAKSRKFEGLLLEKADVNGGAASPVANFAKVNSGDTAPTMWNFGKTLIRKDGTVFKRYGSTTSPLQLEADIKTLVAQ